MGWLKLTSSETGCCRVDLPCSMVPNRVEAGRCRTNLRQETTTRTGRLWTIARVLSMHCFGGALEILRHMDRGRALKRDLALSTGAVIERQQLPGLSIQSHRVSFRWPGLGRLDPSTPRRLGPQAPSRQRGPRARIRSAKGGCILPWWLLLLLRGAGLPQLSDPESGWADGGREEGENW
jgi:hypothetical protein